MTRLPSLFVCCALLTTAGCRRDAGSADEVTVATCPELGQLAPEMALLGEPELENRLLKSNLYPPSLLNTRLAEYKTRRDAKGGTAGHCAYRVELVRELMLARHVGEMGETWGLTHSVEELLQLMREAPTVEDWSPERRQKAIDDAEGLARTRSRAAEGDLDYNRRMALGVALLCQVTPDELKALKARRRPISCERPARQ